MNKFVVVDLETTGTSPQKGDQIIEIGMVTIENDKIVDEFQSMIDPKKPIPSFITKLTGIHDGDVSGASTFSDIARDIYNRIEDSYFVAHNVSFDYGFLNQSYKLNGMKQLNNRVIDTVELTRLLYPQAPGFKLNQLASFFQIEHPDPHRALSDAYVTAVLFLKLKEKLFSLPNETIIQLLKLEKGLISDLRHILERRLENHQVIHDARMDTYNGIAFRKFQVDEQLKQQVTPSFGDYLDGLYGPTGRMQQQMGHYEERIEQRIMSEDIFDSFQMKQHALIEAETGTGKTLAYLIPAIYDAVQTKKRVVISTYTTQLQAQLLEGEIPLIRRLVPFPFYIALLKGKEHYISIEKFASRLQTNEKDNYDVLLTKAMLLVWLTETNTGDIDEIQLPSSGRLFFKHVSAQAEASQPRDDHFHYSFYQQAKQRAQGADIIVTNHALVCMDMLHDNTLIPNYDRVIIDEAHHFAETVSKHYGLTLEYASMIHQLNYMGTMIHYRNLQVTTSNKQRVAELLDETKEKVDTLFRYIFQYVQRQKKFDTSTSDVGRIQYKLTSKVEKQKDWGHIQELTARLTFHIRDSLHLITQTTSHIDSENRNEIDRMTTLLQTYIDKLDHFFLLEQDVRQVNWIEIEASGAKNAVYLYCEPIEVASILQQDLFNQKQSVILTSATMTVNNTFTFIKKELGIADKRLHVRKIQSPFSYDEQVQLMIPSDFPDVRGKDLEAFIYATCEAIMALAEITGGQMLVLFTSYDMLKKAYHLLREFLQAGDYTLIAQGVSSGSRERLKKNFIANNHSILLGTSSFWEGVDIPGRALSCVVIARLPFQVPSHPVYMAKSEALKNSGGNAFMEQALPNAIIRFKQGFGRLIRSRADRGIVFVCDNRIMKARYGKYFLDSIASVPVTFATTRKLMEKGRDWF